MEKYSVIMPAYNEGREVAQYLEKADDKLDAILEEFEIVAVNDGSSDDTKEGIKQASEEIGRVKMVSYEANRGKGGALKEGFQHISEDSTRILFLDADSEFKVERIQRFQKRMDEKDADVIIGSKRHEDSDVTYPTRRRFLSRSYSFMLRMLFDLDVKDTQVGMKLFKREVLDEVFPLILVKDYAMDIEILALANKKGYEIEEAPVNINFEGDSKVDYNAIFNIGWDTMAVFYRLKIIDYYQKKEEDMSG